MGPLGPVAVGEEGPRYLLRQVTGRRHSEGALIPPPFLPRVSVGVREAGDHPFQHIPQIPCRSTAGASGEGSPTSKPLLLPSRWCHVENHLFVDGQPRARPAVFSSRLPPRRRPRSRGSEISNLKLDSSLPPPPHSPRLGSQSGSIAGSPGPWEGLKTPSTFNRSACSWASSSSSLGEDVAVPFLSAERHALAGGASAHPRLLALP